MVIEMLIGFVMFAFMLIGAGIYMDRKKVREVVDMQPKRHMVRCSNCRVWTSLEASDSFDGIGVLCAKCSKQVLAPKGVVEEALTKIEQPVVKKKRGLLMTLIKGDEDY